MYILCNHPYFLLSTSRIGGRGKKRKVSLLVWVGEKSLLRVESGMVKDIEIGVASKDQSLTNLKDLKIINFNDQCFSKYQKKQEFGMGELFHENVFCDKKS